MTITSIETSSPTASSAKIDFAASPNDTSTRTENSEFGQIMSGVMQSSAEAKAMTAGQEVAASSALQPGFPGSFGGDLGASLGGDFLKAVNLGPHMNVITSEATVPDEQSLEAFARSQGLDETAVQWLMGSSPLLTATPPMGLALDSRGLMNGMGATSTEAGSVQINTALSSSETISAHPADALFSSTPLISAMNANSPMAAPGEMSPNVSLGLPPAPPSTTAPGQISNHDLNTANSTPDTVVSSNAFNAAALWAMAQGTEKARVTNPSQEDPSEVAKVQINLMASPAPAAFWMLRNPMAATPSKEAVTTPSAMALSEIDLSQTATPELLDSLTQALAEGTGLNTPAAAGDQPTPLSGHSHRVELAAAARQDAQNPNASASAPDSGNAERSENVQNLAEKMGQAVGQRILSEIEKGQWHLKLSLRPATLGHIEVEMRMRSGELDAVFTAPQALTRELLQEGMSKLKETLNQMGMDVASMQVGDGQTQKRGGESTPGQMSKSANGNSNDPESSVQAAPAPAPQMKMGQDGWDVLV